MRSLDSDLVNPADPDGQANSTPPGRLISSHTEPIPVEREEDRVATGLLSRVERERLVARASYSLYRWYVERSQTKRNWNVFRVTAGTANAQSARVRRDILAAQIDAVTQRQEQPLILSVDCGHLREAQQANALLGVAWHVVCPGPRRA
jgi:hypothetical protein